MLKLGTFYDMETEADYDLYQINARIVKAMLDKSFPVTQLKLNLFNSSTRIKSEIDFEVSRSNGALKFDYKNGMILNRDEYLGSVNNNYYKQEILSNCDTVVVDELKNKRHLMGYELLPLAISVKNRDVANPEKVYLIDGFRRMYYMADIPDVSVFVKVYDILKPRQWSNAMLLYNSWKMVQDKSFELFVDRGFKFGLYTYFGIDVTLYNEMALKPFESYIAKDFYTRMKNNHVLPEDIKTSLDLYDKYVSKGEVGHKSLTERTLSYVLEELFANIGRVRSGEYERGIQADAKIITIEMIDDFFSRPAIDKHLKKVETMRVGGSIENYVDRHLKLPICNLLRSLYGLDELSDEYIRFFGKFGKYDPLTDKQVFDKIIAGDEVAKKQIDRIIV